MAWNVRFDESPTACIERINGTMRTRQTRRNSDKARRAR
jgi:hypothetical protein